MRDQKEIAEKGRAVRDALAEAYARHADEKGVRLTGEGRAIVQAAYDDWREAQGISA